MLNGVIAALGAEPLVLVSWWKPLVLIPPFVAWARVVSSVYDKHAAKYHLNRKGWAAAHLTIGLVAVLAALAIPVASAWTFLISLGVMVALLGGNLLAYPLIANRDSRVPPHGRLTLNFSKWAEAKREKAEAKRAGTAELVVTDAKKAVVRVPERDSPEFAVRLEAEKLLIDAEAARASEIDVKPAADGQYRVVYMVDTVPTPGPVVPAASMTPVLDFWKRAAGMDVEDRRRKQSGRFVYQRGGSSHDVSAHAQGGPGGMALHLRLDTARSVRRKVTDLGLLPRQMDELRAMAADKGGVVLVAAPAHHGGTTTMYSLVQVHDAYTENVQTIEYEIEDQLEGVRQNPFSAQNPEGQEFATLVRSILRRDPDIVCVHDFPDADTAKEIARADLERSRVYLRSTSPNALSALELYVKSVGDMALAAKGVKGLIGERVFRKLCTNCRAAYQATPDMLRKLGLPPDQPRELFKKTGQVLPKGKNQPEPCPVCRGTGYYGTDAAFEIYGVGAEERDAVRKGDFGALKAALRKRQLPTIQQAALRKAVDGITSIEEMLRVTGEQAAKAAGGPGAAKAAAAPASAG